MKIVKTSTTDGFIFSGLYSKADQSKGLILHIHGMGGDIYLNSFYPKMHEIYTQNGWSFLVVEHRGTHSIVDFASTDGDIKTCGNTFELFEDSVIDIQAWLNWATNAGYSKIWLQGHSLGPSKIVHFLINQKNDVAGTIWLSPSDMQGLFKCKEINATLLQEAKELLNNGFPETILSNKYHEWAYISAQTMVNFFDEGSNCYIFNYPDLDNGSKDLEQIRIPVLAFTGTKDYGVTASADPYKAMQDLEKVLANSPRVETLVFDGAEHDFTGFDEAIVEKVIEFINS